jgi:hypothetical protein
MLRAHRNSQEIESTITLRRSPSIENLHELNNTERFRLAIESGITDDLHDLPGRSQINESE